MVFRSTQNAVSPSEACSCGTRKTLKRRKHSMDQGAYPLGEESGHGALSVKAGLIKIQKWLRILNMEGSYSKKALGWGEQ